MAERVSDERCESSPGSNDSLVGYQVRLDSARSVSFSFAHVLCIGFISITSNFVYNISDIFSWVEILECNTPPPWDSPCLLPLPLLWAFV